MSEETFETLLARPGIRVERIVSTGQTTPPDRPHRQAHDEWVMVIAGLARLRIEDGAEIALTPGDHVLIPAGARHWVTHSATTEPTIWIALHIGEAD